MVSLKTIGKNYSKGPTISLRGDIIHFTPYTKTNKISLLESIKDLPKIQLTDQKSHGNRYKGEPLVKWYPNQLTHGYDFVTTSKNVVRFHAAVLKNFPKVTVGSNYRTYEQQVYLFNKFGPYNAKTRTGAAYPGTSNHESGVAIDYSIPQKTFYTSRDSEFKKYILNNIHAQANVLAEKNGAYWHVHIAFPPTVTVGLKARSVVNKEIGC